MRRLVETRGRNADLYRSTAAFWPRSPIPATDQAQALQVCTRIRESLATGTNCHGAHSFSITVSGGVAVARAGDTVYRVKDA
jgi:GGDEF domain-containing protein